MAIHRGIDGSDPLRPQGDSASEIQEERRSARTSHLSSGTLACPECDAPVAPAAQPMSPADPLGCPLCRHTANVRDFLSLTQPTRPAHVDVRVVMRPTPTPARGRPVAR